MVFKLIKLIFAIITVLAKVRGENCSLPEVVVTEGSPRLNKPTLPDGQGYYSFKSKNISIYVLCRSSDSIEWIYTTENTNLTELSTQIFKFSEQPVYRIASYIILQNGSEYGDFYCLKTRNPCGMNIIIIRSHSSHLSTFQIIQLTNATLPPPSKVIYNETAPCPIRMDVKIDFNGRTMAARCLRPDTGEHLNSNLEFKRYMNPIELSANLRQGILPEKCISYLEATDECQGCSSVKRFAFQPTVISCFKGNYKHFVFYPLDSLNGNSTGTKYHRWRDVDFKRMMRINVPSILSDSSPTGEVTVSCIFSSILFLEDLTMPLGFRFNGSSRWNEKKLSYVGANEKENNNIVSEYDFQVKEFNKVAEVNCRARIFNSIKIVNVTKIVSNVGLQPPTFGSRQDIIHFQKGLPLTVNCTAYSDMNMTYDWIFPVAQHLQPNVITTLNMSSLIFPPMSEAYAGSYFCTANNNLGDSIREFVLQPDGRRSQNTFGTIWLSVFGAIAILAFLLYTFAIRTVKSRMKDINYYKMRDKKEVSDIAFSPVEQLQKPDSNVWRSPQPWLKLLSTEPLGRGSFAMVYKVMNLILKEEFALKRVNLYESLRTFNGDLQGVLREIRNLSAVNDPHVVRMFHCWIEDETGELDEGHISSHILQEWSSTRESFLFIMMELCDFTLQYWLEQHSEIYERDDDISKIFRDCISGLSALHGKQIIHRDIKPNNIFCNVSCLSGNPQIWKLGDLGLSTNTEGIDRTLTVIGCRDYRSPEMRIGGSKYNCKTDVFSLGLTYLEVVYPFIDKLKKYEAFEKLRRNLNAPSVTNIFEIDEKYHSLCKLIDRMLCVDPDDRIDVTGCEVVEFFNDIW